MSKETLVPRGGFVPTERPVSDRKNSPLDMCQDTADGPLHEITEEVNQRCADPWSGTRINSGGAEWAGTSMEYYIENL